MTNQPLLNLCIYKVKPGKEPEMEALLAKHWPALRSAGLATNDPPVIYRGLPATDPKDRHARPSTFYELFSWTSAKGPELAHQMPEVMAVWEPMGAICESMEFPAVARVDIRFAQK